MGQDWQDRLGENDKIQVFDSNCDARITLLENYMGRAWQG